MDLYAANVMLSTSMAIHISLLCASMVAHMQDPYSAFHSVMVRKCTLLWSLLTVAPWVEFSTRYHEFITIRALGWDGSRF